MNARRDWIVLRCANASTLRLAESLNAAGIEAWSPAIANPNKTGRKVKNRLMALMPSFVFAQTCHLGELLALEHVLHAHAGFWVWHYHDRIPTVSDASLQPLRMFERKGLPKEQVHKWEQGEECRADSGPYQGLVGLVDGRKGKCLMVTFAGHNWAVELEPWVVSPVSAKAA